MNAVVASECAGLWRRTLLIDADGSADTGTDVLWLQGITGYVDSRGFAGTLHQRADVFEWHRDVELTPAGPHPDAGAMRWEAGTLIETGVHEDYVEHWVRQAGSATPTGALFLAAADATPGLLVRVGDFFGWAGGGEVFVDTVGGNRWNALAIEARGDDLWVNGVRWSIESNEGNVYQ
ncbi:MAG: hypothetical protein HYZ38_21295 [Mycobacterium sp.]|nr:hypothetical protein [Mycobacterium sp.]